MQNLTSLGVYLILAFLLPGIIVTTTIVALVPDAATFLENQGIFEMFGVYLLISFIGAHPPFLAERFLFNPLWEFLYRDFTLNRRLSVGMRRSQIIARAEARGIDHRHYDQTIGEFILFTNTSSWLVVISILTFILPTTTAQNVVAAFVLFGASITQVVACPFFKKSYLDALEAIDNEIR